MMITRKIVLVLVIALWLVMFGTAGAENLLISGDVNADQKVDLQDVISVFKLLTGSDMGPVSPGGDVDGDNRIGLQEALYQLQTNIAANAYLQPFIDAYLTDIVTEEASTDSALKALELTFYLNGETGPALKMPTIEFSDQGFDFSVALGSYTPADGPPESIDTVQVLLYDGLYGAWGYGINQNALTSYLTESPHGNDFSSTYALRIDGIRRISDGTVKGLNDTDPTKGLLLHVTTVAGSEFLVGTGTSARVSATIGTQRMPADDTIQRTALSDTIQEKAAQVETLPVTTGGCPCPVVDILGQLQNSFAKQGIPLTADHLNIKESQPAFTCGTSFEATIRLGSDLEVLESRQKLGQRIRDNDFRRVEPAGYFRGAHYLLVLSFWSWWYPSSGVCRCQFSWELVDVRTGRILAADTVLENCGSLAAAFDSMRGEINNGFEDLQMFMLSDSDFYIPYCDDGNACTWDAFDLKIRQCVHRAKAGSPVTLCDDGDLCTLDDKCVLGQCVGKSKLCNDDNPCTADSCNPDTGECQSLSLADGTPCNDNDLCTDNDSCISGTCTGQPKICNDNNPCSAESCNPVTGQCQTDGPAADGTACDDGDSVTENDVCTSGICNGTINPDNPLPGVPFVTGQPSFSPDPVTYGYKTIVSVPITTDTQKVTLRLWDTSERPNPIIMTYKDNLFGQNLAEIETPWIYADIYDVIAMLYLEFDVYAGNYGGPYSTYSYDPDLSETHYVVYQNDLLGHTLKKISDIPIAWLTVQLP